MRGTLWSLLFFFFYFILFSYSPYSRLFLRYSLFMQRPMVECIFFFFIFTFADARINKYISCAYTHYVRRAVLCCAAAREPAFIRLLQGRGRDFSTVAYAMHISYPENRSFSESVDFVCRLNHSCTLTGDSRRE